MRIDDSRGISYPSANHHPRRSKSCLIKQRHGHAVLSESDAVALARTGLCFIQQFAVEARDPSGLIFGMCGQMGFKREEIRAALHAKIDQLPDDYRTVLLLRDIEELNTSETAQRLQLSLEAVKTRVHRARQALRSLLELSGDS